LRNGGKIVRDTSNGMVELEKVRAIAGNGGFVTVVSEIFSGPSAKFSPNLGGRSLLTKRKEPNQRKMVRK
jgi:hypothetical protein